MPDAGRRRSKFPPLPRTCCGRRGLPRPLGLRGCVRPGVRNSDLGGGRRTVLRAETSVAAAALPHRADAGGRQRDPLSSGLPAPGQALGIQGAELGRDQSPSPAQSGASLRVAVALPRTSQPPRPGARDCRPTLHPTRHRGAPEPRAHTLREGTFTTAECLWGMNENYEKSVSSRASIWPLV